MKHVKEKFYFNFGNIKVNSFYPVLRQFDKSINL